MQYYTFLYNTIRYFTIHAIPSNMTPASARCHLLCIWSNVCFCICQASVESVQQPCSALFLSVVPGKNRKSKWWQDKDEFTRPGRLAHRKSQFHSPGPRQKLQKSIYQLHNNKGLKCIHLTPRILPIRKVPWEQGDPSLHMGEDPNQPLGHFQFYQN